MPNHIIFFFKEKKIVVATKTLNLEDREHVKSQTTRIQNFELWQYLLVSENFRELYFGKGSYTLFNNLVFL